MTLKILTGLVAASIFASLPAYGMEDTASGLKVELDSTFVVKRDPTTDPAYDVLFGVDPASGQLPHVGMSNYLCGITFRAAPQNAEFSQDQINKMIVEEAWNLQARRTLSATMDLETANAFDLDGITGVEFTGIPKIGPGHEDVRLMMSMLETPKGRTTVTCTATKESFDRVASMFHVIRAGVTPPR